MKKSIKITAVALVIALGLVAGGNFVNKITAKIDPPFGFIDLLIDPPFGMVK